ncbi:MAG: hypothetical protein GY943_06250 [Chloroflexi bacterium]|nr:hypothetical protein [Chloroflexota bacterium]
MSEVTEGGIVDIDGKQLQRSYGSRLGNKAIYMANIWDVDNYLVLSQRKTG